MSNTEKHRVFTFEGELAEAVKAVLAKSAVHSLTIEQTKDGKVELYLER